MKSKVLEGVEPVASNDREDMKTKALVKHIKRQERSRRSPRAAARAAAGPNSWSKSVRSWVVEFQKRDRTETQPTFGSLFTDSQPEPRGDTD